MTGPGDRGLSTGRVVLLAGPGEPSTIVFHHLASHFDDVVVVMERPVPRITLARRRAKRLGWVTTLGQVAFVVVALPALRWNARNRIRTIRAGSGLVTSPIPDVRQVASVNAPETVELLRALQPKVVVVNGTRIIADAVLRSVPCPFINIHAGITPRYRGVHGGYWALAEGRPDLVGTTVHLVDAGIDTGGVLAWAYFAPARTDSIATYPYRHLADGLPLVVEQVGRVLAGETRLDAGPGPEGADAQSQLRWHPTLWGYFWARVRRGVR